jgi:hypothetical protein
MVQLKIHPSDGHGLFTTLLCLNANFTMMTPASSHSRQNSNRVLRPKSPNRMEKHICYASSMITTCVTVILDHPITKSSNASAWLGRPPSWLDQHGLLLNVIWLIDDNNNKWWSYELFMALVTYFFTNSDIWYVMSGTPCFFLNLSMWDISYLSIIKCIFIPIIYDTCINLYVIIICCKS